MTDNSEYRDFTRFINGEMRYAEWESYQEIIRTHPESVRAMEQLEQITWIVTQWKDGLLLATEAANEMQRVLRGESK